jgi:hypothetical protein
MLLYFHETIPVSGLKDKNVFLTYICGRNKFRADPSDLGVWGESLQQIACWDCGFESRRGHKCLSVLCVVRQRSLRWAGDPSRVVLPTVVCHFVWYRNLNDDVGLAHVGLLRQRKNEIRHWLFDVALIFVTKFFLCVFLPLLLLDKISSFLKKSIPGVGPHHSVLIVSSVRTSERMTWLITVW